MALPVVQTPKYDVVIPSSKKTIKIRPFLVGEQKVVLQAIEMRDRSQLSNALDDILRACTFESVDIDSLTVQDVEYLILQIRARSVGEFVDINYICQNHIEDKLINIEAMKLNPALDEIRGPGQCETRIPVRINLASLEHTVPDRPDNRIMFTAGIGVVMRDMPYIAYKTIDVNGSSIESGLHAMASCVECVIDGDTIHNRGDFTSEELIGWIERLVEDDFEKMEKFMKSAPELTFSAELTCPSCKAKDSIHLKGLDDFLG